jgi:hypothetical protein
MRKKKVRKLILSRESLRSLATSDLRDVAGALSYDDSRCQSCLVNTVCKSCFPPC